MNLMSGAKALFDNVKLAAKKHSPEILMVVGTLSFAATIYSVRKAAKKEDETLAPIKEEIKELKEQEPTKENTMALAKAYTKCVGRVVRLYSWSGAFAATSIGSFYGAKTILDTRLDNLSAAYILLEKSYKGLKDKIKNKYGEEALDELRTGIKNATDEKEEPPDYKAVVKNMGQRATYFDPSSGRYQSSAHINHETLLNEQTRLNNLLKARARQSHGGIGFVFLYEMYRSLQIPYVSGFQQRAAHVDGWYYDINEAKKYGEFYKVIDFGLNKSFNDRAREGFESVFILDPNVDGNIINMMSDDNYYDE